MSTIPIESEIALLGSMLLNPALVDEVAGELSARDFVTPQHRNIFNSMLKLRAAGNEVCYLSILRSYPGDERDLGGIEYLQKIDEAVATSKTYRVFLEKVINASRVRSLSQRLIECQKFLERPVENFEEAYSHVAAEVFSACSKGESKDLVHISKAAEQAMVEIKAAFDSPGSVSGTSTGIDKLDEMTTGIYPGQLLVLAGRPGMGKTTLALNIAQHVSNQGLPVVIFSLEMPAVQLATKMLTESTGISQTACRSGSLTGREIERLVSAKNNIRDNNIWVHDSSLCTTSEMHSRCRQVRALAGQPIGLIVVDYIQLMSGKTEGKRGVSREQVVSQISRELKIIAKEANAPVLALSQLNRGVESRQDKRPMMSDLRESGAIEQDADAVLMLFRPGYYEDDQPDDLCELIISKQRQGRTGAINLKFDAAVSRFSTWHDEQPRKMKPTREWVL